MRGKGFQREVRGVLSGEKRELSGEGKMVRRKMRMSVVLVSWEEERGLIGEKGLSGERKGVSGRREREREERFMGSRAWLKSWLQC